MPTECRRKKRQPYQIEITFRSKLFWLTKITVCPWSVENSRFETKQYIRALFLSNLLVIIFTGSKKQKNKTSSGSLCDMSVLLFWLYLNREKKRNTNQNQNLNTNCLLTCLSLSLSLSFVFVFFLRCCSSLVYSANTKRQRKKTKTTSKKSRLLSPNISLLPLFPSVCVCVCVCRTCVCLSVCTLL